MSKYKDAMEKFINIQPYISEVIFGEGYWKYENIVLEALEIADRVENAKEPTDEDAIAICRSCQCRDADGCECPELHAYITGYWQAIDDVRGEEYESKNNKDC